MSSLNDHCQQKNKPLLIYSASAGSGKTFRLVLTYLEILLESRNQPKKFRSIVAMTFTNKAALEMKNRIIDGLYQLTVSHKDAKFLEKKLVELLGITPEELKKRAVLAFREILHNYSDFQVSTIDKFNLKLIRSFARDLDISGEFNVVLNEKELLEQVIDSMLSRVGLPDETKLTDLVYFYSLSNLEEGEKWNFRDKLIEFSAIIGNEKYRLLIEKLRVYDFSKENFHHILKEIKKMDEDMVKICHEAFSFFSTLNPDPSTIPGKSKSYTDFELLGTIDRFPKFDQKKGSFLGKSIINGCVKNETETTFDLQLSRSILNLNEVYLEQLPRYILLTKFKENFFNMALLSEISTSLERLKKEEQLIRISDFNVLIGSLVQGEDAPYIYERLGSRLRHFLLDEFQDTSRLQWMNLIPLLHEAISSGNKNLIVGDPKQSIYRFNNGRAEQFVALPGLFNPELDPKIELKSAFFKKMGAVNHLEDNHRSAKAIVQFNNDLFEIITRDLDVKFSSFYSSYKQNTKSEDTGYVEVFSYKNELTDDELFLNIKQKIDECLSDGFKLGDIAILTEKNKQGNNIANFLTNIGYPVVSSDSLLVQYHIKIKLLVSYLKRRVQPTNDTEAKRFAEIYLRLKFPEDHLAIYLSFFDKEIIIKNKTTYIFNDSKFIETYFGTYGSFFFSYDDLYQLGTKVLKLFEWCEEKDPYLHQFLDFIYEFQLTQNSDIRFFLKYYEQKREKLALVLPDSEKAIKIMSIHKSKGLEFPVVILPNINFNTSIKPGSKFLVQIEDKILYTTLSKESPNKALRDCALEELGLISLDKINLLYVALTRAEYRIYAFNEQSGDNLGKKLNAYFGQLPSINEESTYFKLTYGLKESHSGNGGRSQSEILFFHPEPSRDTLWFPDIALTKIEGEAESNEILYGRAFHKLVEHINQHDNVQDILQRLVKTGEIDSFYFERLVKDANTFVEKAGQIKLFDGIIDTISERNIIAGENQLIRPDKIWVKASHVDVVEVKTGLASANHLAQLATYSEALFHIFSKPINSYLYYVNSGEFTKL